MSVRHRESNGYPSNRRGETSADSLHLDLLGTFRLLLDGRPVAGFEHARLQKLAAFLGLHRAVTISRQQLAFLFWPDSTDQQALKNLRTLLARLRHALPDVDRYLEITAQSIQLRLDAPFSLDVTEFEAALAQMAEAQRAGDSTGAAAALATAVELYTDELLPNCYDDWILPLREALRQAYVDALERLIVLLEEYREYGRALPYARRLLNHDPLAEAAYLHLIRLYLALGDRTETLRISRDCDAMLEREFGIVPAPVTRDLYERLLETDGQPPPVIEQQLGMRSFGLPTVGRNTEWSRLMSAWRTAVAGHPQMVLLSGDAGIGKTRLAEELCAWVARQGAAVVVAHCNPASGVAVAYAPVVEWQRDERLRARAAALDDVWLVEDARILPALLVGRPHLKSPGPLTEAWQRTRLFEALARVVLGPDDRAPLLLFLDDLQWCDQETLGMEKGEPGIMDRPPRPVGEPIINREMLIGISVQSVVMTIAVLSSYLLSGVHPGATMSDPNLPMWQTVAFATLTLSELMRAFTARSERISVFKLGVFSNKTMNMAVIFSIVVVIAVIYVPFLQVIFGTVPLAAVDWLWIVLFAVLASIAAEATKTYLRARVKKIETKLTAQMELA